MTIDTKKYRKLLEKELAMVEDELNDVGRQNPKNPTDWEPVETEIDSDHADINDVADNIESFGENRAIVGKLESKYNDIKLALDKIKKGTYGKCEVGGEDILEKRLDANPAARTCIEHAKK